MAQQITRRRFGLALGTVATGAVGGIALGTQKASATVSGSFTIPNGETVVADTTLQDVRLLTLVDWSYQANAPIHATELELHVGQHADTLDLIARQTKDGLGKKSLTGETELSGSLMSASDFDIAMFRPTSGRVTVPVIAELRFYALRDGERAAEAVQRTTFDVSVSAEELQVNIELSATGEVTFTTD